MEYDSYQEIYYHQTSNGFIFSIAEIWCLYLTLLILASCFLYSLIMCMVFNLCKGRNPRKLYFQVKAVSDFKELIGSKYLLSKKSSKISQNGVSSSSSNNENQKLNYQGSSSGSNPKQTNKKNSSSSMSNIKQNLKSKKGQNLAQGSLNQQSANAQTSNSGLNTNNQNGNDSLKDHIYECYSCGFKVNIGPVQSN